MGHPLTTVFPPGARRAVKNHLSGEECHLVRADDLPVAPETVARIVEICREEEIYRWLFRDLFSGREYGPHDARFWLQKSAEGWEAATHFVFAVLDPAGRVIAAADIKSPGDPAEIGYWASRNHSGVMTNTVLAVCDLAAEAGFKSLYARVRSGNKRSAAVLLRAGFSPAGMAEEMQRYTRALARPR